MKNIVLFTLLLVTLASAFWQHTGRADPDQKHTITLAAVQKANAAATCDNLIAKVSTPSSPLYGKHRSLSQINKLFLNLDAIERVENFLKKEGLSYNKVGDHFRIREKVSRLESLLDTQFQQHVHAKTNDIAVTAASFTIPREIVNDVDFVLGTRLPTILPRSIRVTSSAADASQNLKPELINKVYGITNNTVTKATQSLFEALGQDFSPEDLAQFEQAYNLPNIAISKVTGDNDDVECAFNPGDCGEANLDVQYMIAVAQSPETHYRVEPKDPTVDPDPFLKWIIDLSQEENPAMVHSVSYGSIGPENNQTDMIRFNLEACKLGLRGVTIVVASGDDGVSNFLTRGNATACGFTPSFPATSPYVLAVGATMGPEMGKPEIACTSDAGGLITTGGGFSVFFGQPAYQQSAVQNYLSTAPNLPNVTHFASQGRGYPDVSALGHNYELIIAGQTQAESGTSASAPVFAAVLTLINDRRILAGKPVLGFVNPALYKAPSTVWNDITEGRNNCGAGQPGSQVCCPEGFTATKGWDPLTGLGTPKFQPLSDYLFSL